MFKSLHTVDVLGRYTKWPVVSSLQDHLPSSELQVCVCICIHVLISTVYMYVCDAQYCYAYVYIIMYVFKWDGHTYLFVCQL